MSDSRRAAVATHVGEQRPLADLECEQAGLEVVLALRVRELHDEVVALEVAPRDVDGHRERTSRQLRAPRRGLLRRGLDHVATESGPRVGVGHRAEEVAGPEETAGRVVPAQQRLDTAERAVPQVEDGLVREHQLVAVEGARQLLVRSGELSIHGRLRWRPGHVANLSLDDPPGGGSAVGGAPLRVAFSPVDSAARYLLSASSRSASRAAMAGMSFWEISGTSARSPANSRWPMTSIDTGVVATTVAVRGRWSSRAISPT